MKNVAGSLRLDLAAFRELEAFAQLGTDLDAATQAQLDRGYRMVELLKQGQYKPLYIVDQLLSLYAGVNGYLDHVPVNEVPAWEEAFLQFMQDQKSAVWKMLDETKDKGDTLKKADDPTTKAVIEAIEEFNKSYKPAE